MSGVESAPAREKNSVKVLVRVRPLLPQELAQAICVSTAQDGVIELTRGNHSFRSNYETVLPDTTSQDEVYGCLRAAVNDAFNGYNATVLAYGQTGTGKTHTMMGSHDLRSPDGGAFDKLTAADLRQVGELHGIIPRAICDIFARADAARAGGPGTGITIICSYMEIYNDHLYDLLQPYKQHLASRHKLDVRQRKTGLNVKEDGFGQICVQHLMAVKVSDLEHVFRLIKSGNEQRSMRQTELNQNSSRGHSILQFLLEQRPPGGANTVTRSKINFVDLAGSERYPADNSVKTRVTEMTSINVSLSALASVVSALVARDKHVPYRDSKLTHLLKDSLGGNCNTYVIATISASVCSFDENVSTLKFADRASAITNNAVKNVQLDLKNLLELKDREIDRLRAMVMAFAERHQGGEGGDAQRAAAEASGTTEGDVRSLKGQIEQLQDALDVERRRAAELESRMRGVTVLESPDLLDADTARREASLAGSAGPSAPRQQRGFPPRTGARPLSGKARPDGTKSANLADDLSMFTLGPAPLDAPGRVFGSPQHRAEQSLSRSAEPGVVSPGSGKPGGLKRRPPGRARQKQAAEESQASVLGGTQLRATLTPPPEVKFAQPLREGQRIQDGGYQNLVEMYSALASAVARLSASAAHAQPDAAGARSMAIADKTPKGTVSLRHLDGHPGGGVAANGQNKAGWGLRSVMVSTSAPMAPPQATDSRARTALTEPPAAAASGGFGLRSILKHDASSSDLPLKSAAHALQQQQARGPSAAKARAKDPDTFDAGSWIYIMGTSASSVKAKQIAKSTRNDPRLAQLALKSIDLESRRR